MAAQIDQEMHHPVVRQPETAAAAAHASQALLQMSMLSACVAPSLTDMAQELAVGLQGCPTSLCCFS